MEYCCCILAGAVNPHFPALIVYTALWVMTSPPTLQLLSHRCTVASLSLLYGYFHDKHTDKVYSLVSPFQTFTANTHLATSTGLTHPHCLRILLVRKTFYLNDFFQRTDTLWNTPAWMIPLHTTILAFSSPRPIVIYPSYHHLHFSLPPLTSLTHTSFNNHQL